MSYLGSGDRQVRYPRNISAGIVRAVELSEGRIMVPALPSLIALIDPVRDH